jgi:hypothetical protein
MTKNQKASFTSAIKAYFIAKEEYRKRRKPIDP